MSILLAYFKNITVISYHNLNRYIKFIESIDTNRKLIYCERHHILPRSLFKEYENSDFNIINLTPREHFIAHLLLARAVGGKMWLAVRCMSNAKPEQLNRGEYKVNSKIYERIRIESSKILAQLAVTRRANETIEQKISRVRKWQKNFYNKSLEEKALIWKRNSQTRIKNETVIYFLCSCVLCRALTKNINRHKCKVLRVKVTRARKVKIKSIKVLINRTCTICNRTNFRSEKAFEVHTIKYQTRVENKIKKEQAQKNRLCTVCFTQFKSDFYFNKHKEVGTCNLPIEEQKSIARNKAMQTMKNKSVEEKEAYSKLLSQKRKKYLQSLSNEELTLYHNKLSESAIAYYNSDMYNAEIKSQQVKAGLKNGKHSKN